MEECSRKGLSAGEEFNPRLPQKLSAITEQEIENFVPEEYWNIGALLSKDDGRTFPAKFNGLINKKLELKNKEDVDRVLTRH